MNHVTLDERQCADAESHDHYLEIDEALAELEQRSCVIVPAVPREIPRQMLER
jgi:hypothetical protein